ncbi:hypothetical protein QN277_004303 [Acacia crassicarpa]|uniref:Uncharacterized protein n=1 Tax=Acacia crassicarpa TaxID=499986 RepID=A0AAE1MI88_9FABA|nr:hypothetical protein QN277_004303 [Acacia crassicarpa]
MLKGILFQCAQCGGQEIPVMDLCEEMIDKALSLGVQDALLALDHKTIVVIELPVFIFSILYDRTNTRKLYSKIPKSSNGGRAREETEEEKSSKTGEIGAREFGLYSSTFGGGSFS